MDINEFDFELPEELIAYEPLEERDKCRLLVVNRKTSSFEERVFYEIIQYFSSGDVLVLNNSKVIKARLMTKHQRTGREHEVLVANFQDEYNFQAIVKGLSKLKVGDVLEVGEFKFTLVGTSEGLGIFRSNLKFTIEELNKLGEIPLPPYIEKRRRKLNLPRVSEEDDVFYQTVYSSVYGSIASPTAGLHFTKELLDTIQKEGILVRYITLHVGPGTFEPVRTKKIEDFKLKSEYMEVSASLIEEILQAKERGKKVIAVGTTVVRALETVFRDINRNRKGFKGETDIFIYPGFEFKVVDSLITNFHLPKSSLILLVSAFAGKDLIINAYRYAVDRRFRFYSYGDAMLII
ncbi:MAG: tRNA preQ1(34) S-adenosylmethionine ribosyltransferase-isomerase QueA [Spirochaetia bacterium]|nr:tRNA preQ1(34) S-adenosylmethionine ribosyltransferase-isomerase QueA [Spirochaetota bacterium]MCX8096233.1 tRNA preQ1(34) S-adenosylmethionine ribosyltransferase-isomerase QueA [Spirochaetota bacterium]MDW8112949.1 tRNA preQ1(34) S-adenosylmethionine ribosyltransferase-isomerase QueA [Spirochaetia bacterium]